MNVLRAGESRVTVKKPVFQRVTDAVEPCFEESGVEILAAIQPVSAEMKQRLYGEEKVELRLMLTGTALELKEGFGVCVERQDGVCDFQIARPVEHWMGHKRAILRRLREDEDGAGEP